jgi:23S rRNA (cytosine1962-C5)-methyltransferase
MAGTVARLVLRKNQDRSVRGGHPWIFSNEIAELAGEPKDGDLVEVNDARGAFLGRAYLNRKSLIAARLISRGRDEVDAALFTKRIERAARLRETFYPGAEAVRVVYGESDQMPGLVVDRYGDVLAVQILTLGMETRAELVREALERVLVPRGAVRLADSPLRTLEVCHSSANGGGARCPIASRWTSRAFASRPIS